MSFFRSIFLLRRPGVTHGRAGILVIFTALVLTGCAVPPATPPPVRDGVLDLRAFGFDRVVDLEGTWRARAGVDSTAFTAYDYRDDHWDAVPVPGLFTEQGFPDEGLVWYRLHVRLPREAPRLRGFVDYVRNASAVYVARPGRAPELVAGNGRPALQSDAMVPSRATFSFILPPDTAFVLVWKVANHHYRGGGPMRPLRLGPERAVEGARYRAVGASFLRIGVCLLLTVLFFLQWMWDRRDAAAPTVSLIALCIASREAATQGALEHLFPFVGYEGRIVIESISYFSLPGLFCYFLWAVFPREFLPLRSRRLRLAAVPQFRLQRPGDPARDRPDLPAWIRGFNTAVTCTAIGLSAASVIVAAVAPLSVVALVSTVFRYCTLVLIVATFLTVLVITERRREMSVPFFIGYSLIAIGGVHDVFVRAGTLPGPFILPHLFLGFVLVLSYIVALRGARNAYFVQHSARILEAEVARQTEALQQATDRAQAANEAKSQFLSAVSHELRTPLAAIQGFTQVLEEEAAPRLAEHEVEFLQLIASSSHRLLALVDDLLDLAKAEAGHLHLELGVVSVNEQAYDAAGQVVHLAEAKGLRLSVEETTGERWARADATRLRQVILNLLSNAVKFTETGRVTLRIGDAVLPGADGDEPKPAVAIAVEDTGVGISAAFMPHLFERFSQEASAYGQTQRGTGLGLAISRELIVRMGGHLTAESQAGAGSTFTVLLPCIDPPALLPPATRAASLADPV